VTTGPAAPAVAARRRVEIALAALKSLAVLGAIVGGVSLRVVLAGEREIAESTDALRRGDAYAAAVHARRAAGWYAPGAPHVRVAYARLTALATAAEGIGNAEVALLAWRGVRTAVLETRWLLTPHQEDLERADAAIARLSAAQPRPPGTRTEPAAVVERQHLEALARDEAPRRGWVAALVAGFVAWVGGAAWGVHRGVDRDVDRGGDRGVDRGVHRGVHRGVRWAWRRAAPALAICAAGVALWLLAIWRA